MAFPAYKPALPLSRYVDLMWLVEHPGGGPVRQRVYPSGEMALVIHLKKPTVDYFIDHEAYSVRVPSLTGPYSRCFDLDRSRPTALIGVSLRPGAAHALFSVGAHELHNMDMALSDLNPECADQLLNDVCSAADVMAQFLALERGLTRILRNALPIHSAVGYAVERLSAQGGMRSVRRIQLETGLSHTRFIQLFREHVGLTPKLFCVRRFHSLLGRIDRGMPVNWADLAADCGYFDQAHLIRDFRTFAGMTPREYGRDAPKADGWTLAALESAMS